MDWKEFFRPTKYKIVFVIIVFVLSLFFGFRHIPSNCEPGMIGCSTSGSLESNKIIFPLSYTIAPMFFERSPILAPILTFGVIYMLGIIYWYLLSCITFTIVDKFKK